MFSHSAESNSLVTPWTVVYQAPLSLDFSGKDTGEGCSISFSRNSSRFRDWTFISCVSCTAGRLFTYWAMEKLVYKYTYSLKYYKL